MDLERKTLVIFTSDNGGVGGYERLGIAAGSITDNAPLRGGKGMLYEGGIRVPYIFRWPGQIPPGRQCDFPITSVDLMPTLLALAGGQAPAGYPLDGISYAELLFSGGQGSLPERPIFWHFPGYLGAGQGTWRTTPAGAIRLGDWKLIEFFEDGRLELYDLRNDIGEKENLAAKFPDRAAQLHEKLKAWRKAVGALIPAPHTPEPKAAKRTTGRTRPARKQ